ncbi:hypothetical protein SMACR_08824 [Sordaria macrospora]|uniref:WGS project CABT00000000 data, contig 2.66 n=2 Tax=Sordaria macrospora TaxID=5147 RepID=F7WAX0_SORMK|nr:uncharacterized protein SMAC_08824 [Sordaria macrospora k-hell]KAA8628050.1 hypothetical protein SMACR_08824 [Sordaria macrospora]WPJ62829.1 hypothetical protein SMAC4_08824 [Sordaria macrospora]CCC14285.1 unnamed protein product [Sordaria macrospora k-hell]
MCQLKYVLTPWNAYHTHISSRESCHLVSITWCAAQFPGDQGTGHAQIEFGRDTSHEHILAHLILAHQCPYYDNVEIERTREWYYYGSVITFALEELPPARRRFTTTASWVQEHFMAAARARGWEESSAEGTTDDGGGGHGAGIQMERKEVPEKGWKQFKAKE